MDFSSLPFSTQANFQRVQELQDNNNNKEKHVRLRYVHVIMKAIMIKNKG